MKSYKEIQEILKKSNLSKDEIKETKLYKYIKEKIIWSKENENVFFSNITSMCLEKNYENVRIRNDKFLSLAKENKNGFIISSIKLNNKTFVLCFHTKMFTNYEFSNNQSNSFITFKLSDIQNKFVFDNNDNVVIKNKKSNKYIFYVSIDENFNSEKFGEFLEKIDNFDIKKLDVDIVKFFVPPIPNKIRNKIRNDYDDYCALENCPCGKSININFLKENNLTYTHLHHFVPKELFIEKKWNKEGCLDWSVIHNSINLIPLCLPCHQAIHKGSYMKELVVNTFEKIIKKYKEKNQLDKLLKYLNDNFNYQIDDLLNFYLK